MKKILNLTGLLSLFVCHVFAQQTLVVRENGEGGAYGTIAEALSAAAPGDIVSIRPLSDGRKYVEDILIDKSLTLVSEIDDDRFKITGDISITPSPGMKVVIINGHSAHIKTIANSAAGTVSKFSVLNCKSGTVSLNHGNCHLTMAYSEVNRVEFRSGNLYGNKILGSTLHGAVIVSAQQASEEPPSDDVIRIWGNDINNDGRFAFILQSTTHLYDVRNNLFTFDAIGGEITGWKSTGENIFYNNTFKQDLAHDNYGSVGIELQGLPANAVISIYNNIFSVKGNGLYQTKGVDKKSTTLGTVKYSYNITNATFSMARWTDAYDPDIHEYYVEVPVDASNIKTTVTAPFLPDTFDAEGRCTLAIDKGHTGSLYRDLDLTRNDAGCFGGPYSIQTYRQQRTVSGRPRIFHLEIPNKIPEGQTFNVKAYGFDN